MISLGEVKLVKGKRTVTYKNVFVPAPYARVVSQMSAEVRHGAKSSGHESRRRLAFAKEVLHEFWAELQQPRDSLEGFRSVVLTPILQRQLWGIEENYRPMVERAVAQGGEEPTIKQATKFYLERDPTDHRWIGTYRRNLLYVPEARWHLRVMMNQIAVGDEEAYDHMRDRTDELHRVRKMDYNDDNRFIRYGDENDGESEENWVSHKPPRVYTKAEVGVIIEEELDEFFDVETWSSVRFLLSSCLSSLIPKQCSQSPGAKR